MIQRDRQEQIDRFRLVVMNRRAPLLQAFSEMHQGKRKNATGLSHSIKIVVLSHVKTTP